MIIELKVPSPGESITEVQIARWLKKDGDFVEKDEAVCEIDSDKATLTVNAEEAGALKVLVAEGETVKVGSVICSIDTSVKGESKPKKEVDNKQSTVAKKTEAVEEKKISQQATASYANGIPSVAAKKIMEEKNIPASKIAATGKDGRITKSDVLNALSSGFKEASSPLERTQERAKMSPLRKKTGSAISCC